MIKYLLKFVSQEDYAEKLVKGTFFMRPASYFHALEKGQGDISESAISHYMCVYKHSHVPIYCMYSVMDTDIMENKVTISERCIKDFKCADGYVVIIDFPLFEEKLKTFQSEGYEVCGGLVNYHFLTWDDTVKLMNDNTPRNVFIKHPDFAYQKEFRIVVCHELYKPGQPTIDAKEYHLSSDLKDIAIMQKVPEPQQDGNYILSL